MKISNKMAALLLALGIVSQASADPVIYLTGSTAFRSTIYAALNNQGGTNVGGVFDTNSVTSIEFGNSAANGGTYMIFHGTIAGAGVYVNCAWSGSEAGIAAACGTTLINQDRNGNPIPLAGSPETWISVTNLTLTSTTTIISTNPAAGSPLYEPSSHIADLTQADTSQAISWTPPAGGATALKDFGVEAIVTFTITRNAQTAASNEWNHCSNITLPQLNTLLANGVAPAGFISGNTNDNDFTVYLVGRNLGSGTRMNMLGDSTYGAHSSVSQFSIGYGVEETPHINSLILTNEGNNGYESGGDVAKALGITGSCQQADPFNGGLGWFALGYVGPSDALNTGNFGGEPTNNWMTVDGVFSSNGSIENGTWWLWGHEHLYGKNGINSTALTVGNALFHAAGLTVKSSGYGVDPNAHDPGIQISLMHVTKSSDVSFPSF